MFFGKVLKGIGEGLFLTGVFIDLSKAFDTNCHNIFMFLGKVLKGIQRRALFNSFHLY